MVFVFVLLALAVLVALTVWLVRVLFPQPRGEGTTGYPASSRDMEVWGHMEKAMFPTAGAAWQFAVAARAKGHKAKVLASVSLLTRGSLLVTLLAALLGGVILGLLGAFAEAGLLGLPRLEPLFAAPVGSVTTFLAVVGVSLGALVAGLVTLHPVKASDDSTRHVHLMGEPDRSSIEPLVKQHGGEMVTGVDAEHEGQDNSVRSDSKRGKKKSKRGTGPGVNRWLAWLIVVLTAGVLLTGTAYIWFLAATYGRGSDQQSRIGYTLKNVQRVPADTPEAAGEAVAEILGGDTLAVPADPIAAAVLAPVAAANGQTLVYGAGANETPDFTTNRAGLVEASAVAVVVADEEPAYALPAAYAAAHFGAPVVRISEVGDVLADVSDKLLLVAAPARLISGDALEELEQYGEVERVADDGLYRHALLWAQGRWGDFGWGIDPSFNRDGYYYMTLTNPEDPGFAAAGLPTSYLGNYGPLLYTPTADLEELTDQFFWSVSPDFYSAPSDGPFMNVRVLGGPDSVSYNAQARADLALETHQYRNQAEGASGLALLGWSWFVIGLAGAIWLLFAIPARVPDAGFYPRLYWPLATLVLGPIGIITFIVSYQGRPIDRSGPMPSFVRPLWARAVSATIMGMGLGMGVMIASMYLFELNGLPLFTWFEFTPLFWLGAPMASVMWMIMVIPAILISALLFMGPMMGEMNKVGYGQGVKKAFGPVAISMVAASVGMWTLAWWWMNWKPLMAEEDLWLWVSPLWWAAAMGFLTALIPNYLMARAGTKNGSM